MDNVVDFANHFGPGKHRFIMYRKGELLYRYRNSAHTAWSFRQDRDVVRETGFDSEISSFCCASRFVKTSDGMKTVGVNHKFYLVNK